MKSGHLFSHSSHNSGFQTFKRPPRIATCIVYALHMRQLLSYILLRVGDPPNCGPESKSSMRHAQLNCANCQNSTEVRDLQVRNLQGSGTSNAKLKTLSQRTRSQGIVLDCVPNLGNHKMSGFPLNRPLATSCSFC